MDFIWIYFKVPALWKALPSKSHRCCVRAAKWQCDVHRKPEFISHDVSDLEPIISYIDFAIKCRTSPSSRRGKLRWNLSRRSHPMIIKCKKSRRFNVHFMGTSGGPYKVQDAHRYMAAVKTAPPIALALCRLTWMDQMFTECHKVALHPYTTL